MTVSLFMLILVAACSIHKMLPLCPVLNSISCFLILRCYDQVPFRLQLLFFASGITVKYAPCIQTLSLQYVPVLGPLQSSGSLSTEPPVNCALIYRPFPFSHHMSILFQYSSFDIYYTCGSG